VNEPLTVEGYTHLGELVVLREPRDGDVKPDEGNEFADWGPTMVKPAFAIHRFMICVSGDTDIVGSLSWHEVWYGPTTGSKAWNIGIALGVDARGRGIGSIAQRLLAEYLFASTDAMRVEASTDIANVSEQRALERAGFTREGVLRQAQQRADGHHDLFSYSIVRSDVEGRQ